VRRHLGWVFGLALVVAGVVLQLTHRAPQEFGEHYIAVSKDPRYNNFMEPPHSAEFVLLTHGQVVGQIVMVAGLLVLAGWLGFVLGRRKRPSSQGSETN
jgi:hypothetical protein